MPRKKKVPTWLIIPSELKKWAGWIAGGASVIIAPGRYKISAIDGGALIISVPTNRVFKAKVIKKGRLVDLEPDGSDKVSPLPVISVLTSYEDAKKHATIEKE